jgi:hypothetical protein
VTDTRTLDQPTALILLRSEQMTVADYLQRCRENGWDAKAGITRDALVKAGDTI